MCKRHHKSVPNCLRFETNAEERGLKTPRPSLLQSEVRLRQVPCWQAFSPVFWSLLASYLFIDVISNLGKLSKLECDIKLALLLRWLVRRVFTRCSLCVVPYIFSFRFREVNLQIAESIWCRANSSLYKHFGSPRVGQLGQSETIAACDCAVLDNQSMRELCWLGQMGQLFPHQDSVVCVILFVLTAVRHGSLSKGVFERHTSTGS